MLIKNTLTFLKNNSSFIFTLFYEETEKLIMMKFDNVYVINELGNIFAKIFLPQKYLHSRKPTQMRQNVY